MKREDDLGSRHKCHRARFIIKVTLHVKLAEIRHSKARCLE